MKLSCQSGYLGDYLLELDEVDYSHPLIKSKVNDLFAFPFDEIEAVKVAFEYVRDNITHSFDIQSSRVTCKAAIVNQKVNHCAD